MANFQKILMLARIERRGARIVNICKYLAKYPKVFKKNAVTIFVVIFILKEMVLQFNQFNYYSLLAKNEIRTNQEYNDTLDLISQIEKCKTIVQIKSLLKQKLNIAEEVSNYKLGVLGHLSTQNTDKYFKVNVEYDNNVSICVFPKKECKEGV